MRIFNLEDDRYAPMSAYSKGMRQKILISAALLHDPDIIVLDEPNSGLDVTSSLVLRSLVQDARGRRQDGDLQLAHPRNRREGGDRRADPSRLRTSSRTIRFRGCAICMALPSLEQVFRKVVIAADVDQVARDLVGVMRL